MNFIFKYPNTPNTAILSSTIFQSTLNQPLLLKLVYLTNLIILILKFFKTEIIRFKDILKSAVTHLSRPFIPTTVIKKITITAVF